MTAREIGTNLAKIGFFIDKAKDQAVDEVAELIFTESTEIYCPVDTGFLKSSASNEVTSRGFVYTRTISYSANYAEPVHELPYQHHNPATASWKYLEIPFNKHAPHFISVLESKLGGL